MDTGRCPWCGDDPLYQHYHDTEWGVPVQDDRTWFEFLLLEGAQAGLSWITVLRKREAYRQAFADFDPEAVARFDAQDEARLLTDPGIVRNRLKISSAVSNARAFLELQEEHGSFNDWIWGWVDGRPIINRFATMGEVPASTPLSEAMSKQLKKLGFRFVGPTIVYAFMQATGLVNDHLVSCPRWAELQEETSQ
ncbi:DNA-3-methyladenine glycosylase I [Wenzhouxiangella marina]|uniref:DNA-3-methyladenine glycosylase I n=1 Tax=Wenzhouxiangella marina TaxID=1579979 RepID=A0A0K0XZH8_9GAMM|nr:DNA-3-methyladenine glycosylase I [Wenzhouxiangella marina]AKS43089.1 DNA-3-methyladenine glycosylase I [Wenzhouxiangella marina]MBB6087227.1 DNA-3-methyladenine glycosylase I [Wenzhouxiangella marina]